MATERSEDDPGRRPTRLRTASVFVRAAHLLGVGAVSGAWLIGEAGSLAHEWWIVVGVSGVLLLVAEFLLHDDLQRTVAGWATLVKLVLVAAIALVPVAAPWLMGAAIVVAAVGAHAPRGWRHRRVF
jgi:hypothetical protein